MCFAECFNGLCLAGVGIGADAAHKQGPEDGQAARGGGQDPADREGDGSRGSRVVIGRARVRAGSHGGGGGRAGGAPGTVINASATENFIVKGAPMGGMTEKDVIAATGLSDDVVRRTRLAKLKNGEDWSRDEGTMSILYTEKGLVRLQEALGGIVIAASPPVVAGAGGQPMPLAKKEGAADGDGMVRNLTVERVCPNPTWVMCRDGEELVKVRVANNRQIVRGKVLKDCVLKSETWIYRGRCW